MMKPQLTACDLKKKLMVIDDHGYNNIHLMGENATRPIAPLFARPALLLLLAWNDHTASSRLAGQAKTCTLRRVQLRFLG